MTTLSTPLRADRIYVRDKNGKLFCKCPNEETAAAIVAMSEDAKRLREAVNELLAEYGNINGNISMVTPTERVLAVWGRAKAALAAGGDSDQSKTASQ